MASRTEMVKSKQDLFLFVDMTGGEADLLRDAIAEIEKSSANDPTIISTETEAENKSLSLIILYAPRKIADLSNALFLRLEALAEGFPHVPAVVITDFSDVDFVNECYQRGIRGMIGTTLSVAATKQALQLVASGGIFVPVSFLTMVSQSVD